MSDIRFRCPSCHAKLAVAADGAGVEIPCPKCSLPVTIPQRSTIPARVSPRGERTGMDTTVIRDELVQVRTELEKQRATAAEDRRRFEQDLIRKVKDAQAERQQLEHQLEKQKADTRSEQEGRTQLEAAQAEIRRECEAAQTELKQERERRVQLEKLAMEERQSLQAERDTAHRRESEQASAFEHAREKLEQAFQTNLAAAESAGAELRQRVTDREAERDRLREERDAERTTLTRERATWERREEALIAARDELKQTLRQRDSEMETERDGMKAELEKRMATVGEIQSRLDADRQAWGEETAALREQLADLQSVLDGERESWTKARALMDAEREELAARQDLEKAERIEEARREQAAEAEKAMQALEAKRQAAEAKMEALHKTVDDHREGVKRERREREVREQELESERVELMERLARREVAVEEEHRAREQAVAARDQEHAAHVEMLRQEQEAAAQREQAERERLLADLATELDQARATLAAQQEAIENDHQRAEEREQAFAEERDQLRRNVAELESRAAREREQRERVLEDVEPADASPLAQPPRTVRALAEEARTQDIPLMPPQARPPSASKSNHVQLHDPDPKDDASETDPDAGEYLVSPFQDARSTGNRSLSVLGWLCLLAGAATLILRIDWLRPALVLSGLAFLFGVLAATGHRSPLATGLVVMSLVVPLLLLSGHRWAGFEGLLVGSDYGVARARPHLPAPGNRPGPEGTVSVPTVIPGAAAMPTAGIGDSVVVDGVRVRLDAVKAGPIIIHDILGKTVAPPTTYLVVDVTLENTRTNQSVYLKKAWEKARLVDDADTSLYIIHQQRLGLDQVEGSIGSTELEPGVPQSDRMVFDLPPDEAQSFLIISDPGIYAAVDGGLPRTLSRDSLRFQFTREQIRFLPAEPASASSGD